MVGRHQGIIQSAMIWYIFLMIEWYLECSLPPDARDSEADTPASAQTANSVRVPVLEK